VSRPGRSVAAVGLSAAAAIGLIRYLSAGNSLALLLRIAPTVLMAGVLKGAVLKFLGAVQPYPSAIVANVVSELIGLGFDHAHLEVGDREKSVGCAGYPRCLFTCYLLPSASGRGKSEREQGPGHKARQLSSLQIPYALSPERRSPCPSLRSSPNAREFFRLLSRSSFYSRYSSFPPLARLRPIAVSPSSALLTASS